MVKAQEPTAIPGIRYYKPASDEVLTGLDGNLQIPLGEIVLPLPEEDFQSLGTERPSYDQIGRGIYLALRSNPDCRHAAHYADLLKQAYPHYISELATHIVMLDKKEVDTPYLDRKIAYLKIFALVEPDNHQLLSQIGLALLEKGLSLPALKTTTVSLYGAETFLRKAAALEPDDTPCQFHLGEVCYLLGKYEEATTIWGAIMSRLSPDQKNQMVRRVEHIQKGQLPRVPAVDYLQALAVAFEHHQQQEYEEAAAIMQDVLDDEIFMKEFPLAPVHYILGLCCAELGMPRHAENCFKEVLTIDPDNHEAQEALSNLYR